jgi:hypothetical protein
MAVYFPNHSAICEIHYRTLWRLRRTSPRTHDLAFPHDPVCLLAPIGSWTIVGSPHIEVQWLVYGTNYNSTRPISTARMVSCCLGEQSAPLIGEHTNEDP